MFEPRHATVAHIGVAVGDAETAAAFYRDILGLVPGAPEEHDGATIIAFRVGDVDIELLQPMTTDGPIARFLERRGSGIHHVCFRVPDLDAALRECEAHGYRLVDEIPRAGHGGRRIAFLHPKSTGGILIELTE